MSFIRPNISGTLPAMQATWEALKDDVRSIKVDQKSWITHEHPLGDLEEDDFGLVAHLVGRSFLDKNIPHPTHIFERFIDFFETLEDNDAVIEGYGLDKDLFVDLKEQLEGCHTIAEELRVLIKENNEERIDTYAKELAERFKENRKGWFPILEGAEGTGYPLIVKVNLDHGYSIVDCRSKDFKQETSHTTIEQVTKDPLSGEVQHAFKTQQCVTVKAGDKTRLADVAFFKELIRSVVLPIWQQRPFSVSEEVLYKSLPKFVKGSMKAEGAFKKNSRTSDYDVKTVMTAMFTHLKNPLQYKKLKFLWETQALVSYFRELTQEEDGLSLLDGRQVKLLDDAIHNLARQAAKLKGLTDDQLEEIHCTITEMREAIDAYEELSDHDRFLKYYELLRREGANQAELDELMRRHQERQPLPQTFDPFNPPERIAIPRSNRNHMVVGGGGYTASGPRRNRANQLVQEIVNGGPEDLERFVDEISRDRGFLPGSFHYKDAEKRAVFDCLMAKFAEVVCDLPLKWEEGTEVESTMQRLHTLLGCLIQLQGVMSPQSKHSPEATVMIWIIYTSFLSLAPQLPGSRLTPGDLEHLDWMDLLLELRSPHFIIKQPNLAKKLHELMLHFDPEWTVEKLKTPLTMEQKEKAGRDLFAFKESNSTHYIPFNVRLKAGEISKSMAFWADYLGDQEIRKRVVGVLREKNKKLETVFKEQIEEYKEKKRKYERERDAKRKEIVDLERSYSQRERSLRHVLQGLSEEQRTIYDQIVTLEEEVAWAPSSQKIGELNTLKSRLPTYGRIKTIQDRIDSVREEIQTEENNLQILKYHFKMIRVPRDPGHYPEHSIIDQVVVLLTEQDILPDHLQLIHQAALKVQYFHHYKGYGYFDPRAMRMQMRADRWYPITKGTSRRSLKLSIVSLNEDGNQLTLPFYDARMFGQEPFLLKKLFLHNLMHLEKEGAAQNKVMVKYPTHFDAETSVARKIEMMGINPYSEVATTLAILRDHMDLLKEPAMQAMLRVHLFRAERLLSQLEDRPEIVDAIGDFIREGVKHYRQFEDTETCLFFIEVGAAIREMVEGLGYKNTLPDLRKLAKEKILKGETDDAAKLKVFQTLVATSRDDESVAEDLLCMKVLKKRQRGRVDCSEEKEAAIQSVMDRRGNESINEIDDSALNHLIRMMFPDFEGQRWQRNGNVFTSSEGDFEVNALTGLVLHEGDPLVGLPEWIQDSGYIKSVYDKDFKECKEIEKDRHYVINPGTEDEIEVISSYRRNNIQIFRKIDGKDYRHIVLPEDLIENYPSLLDQKDLCWVCESEPYILVCRAGDPILKIDRNDHSRITRLSDNQESVPFHLVRNRIQNLAEFEQNPRYIECWKIDDDHTQVVFTRLGLNFVVNREKIHCQQYPGFYLADNEAIRAFPEGLKRITLENASGDKKVLIPHYRLEDVSDLKRLPFTPPPLTLENPMPWLEYEVKDQQITSRQVSHQLFELLLWSIKGDFQVTAKILERLNPLSRFTGEEYAFIEKIGKVLAMQNHPEAKAMLLKLMLVVRANGPKFPLPEGAEEKPLPIELIVKTYFLYHTNRANATNVSLSVEEEKKILEVIYTQLKKSVTDPKGKTTKNQSNQSGLSELERKNQAVMETAERVFGKAGKKIAGMLAYEGMDQLFGSRFRYLNTNQMSPGKRKITVLKKREFTDWTLTEKQLVQMFFKDLQDQELSIEEQLKNCFQALKRGSSLWKAHFVPLYRAARNGTKEQKVQLAKLLDLESHVRSNEREMIQKILRNPKKYPSYEAIYEKYQKWVDAVENHKEAENQEGITRNQLERHARALQTHFASKEARNKARKEYDTAVAEVEKASRNEKLAKAKIEEAKSGFEGRFRGMLPSQWSLLFYRVLLPFIHNFYHFVLKPFVKSFFIEWRHRYQERNLPGKKGGPRLMCDGKSLEDADKAFDAYFSGLLNQYFEKQEVHHSAEHLERLSQDTSDQNVKEKLTQENDDLAVYRANRQPRVIYRAKESLEDLQRELESKIKTLQKSLKTQKVALLWQVNHIPETADQCLLRKLHKGGRRGEITWEQLRKLSLEGGLKGSEAINVANYLVRASRLDQMKKVLEAIQKVKRQNGDEIYLQKIPEALQMIRHYKPSTDKMDQLWFETMNHILYREKQIELFGKALENDQEDLLIEAPTGFGKTKAVIPTTNIKGVQVNIFPATLERQNAADNQKELEGLGLKVDRFTFQRTSNISAANLKTLYEELQKDFRLGYPITIRSESIRALELHFILTLHEVTSNKGAMKDANLKIEYFSKILRLMRTARANTDESDHTLDPIERLIYTLGDSEILPKEELDLIEDLFNQLIDLVPIRENQQPLLTDDEYAVVADKLADHFARRFRFEGTMKAEFKDYVLGKRATVPQWIEKHPRRSKLALVKGELFYILRSCLRGYVNENFGLSHKHFDKKEYAISYSSSNTPKENDINPSQFKNPHETWNKTMMTYLHLGLKQGQVRRLIKRMQVAHKKEGKSLGSLAGTTAGILFEEILPDDKKHLVLHKITDRQIDEIWEHVSQQKRAIFYYLKTVVAEQLRIYPWSIVSTTQDLRKMFASTIGYSATPQSKESYGPNTHEIPMKGTSGEVTHLLLNKAKTLHFLDAIDPQMVLKELVEKVLPSNDKIHSIIDIGALLRGISNRKVANQLRKAFVDREIEAIQFFDDEEQKKFVMMDVKTGKLHDPEVMKLDETKVFNFYDQSRCFGSDLKNPPDGVGLLLVGKNRKAVIGQGAGRMRQWHLDQGIEVAIPKAIQDSDSTIQDLLNDWVENQVRNDEQKNYDAQRQQMDTEVRSALMTKLLGTDSKPNIKRILTLFKKFKDALIFKESYDPWEIYAKIPQDKEAIDSLKAHASRCKAKMNALSGLTRAEKKGILKRLDGYAAKWTQMPLPKWVKATSHGLETECEILQEVEEEQEVEMMVQRQNYYRERLPSKWPEDLDLFKPGWEVPKKRYVFFARVVKFIKNLEPETPAFKLGVRFAARFTLAAIPAIAATVATVALPIFGLVIAALWIGAFGFALGMTIRDAILMSRRVEPLNCTYRVRDILDIHLPSRVRSGAKFFSPGFLVTNNFSQQATPSVSEKEQGVFDGEQKPTFEVLVIKDGASKVQLLLIDQNDSIFFRRLLKKDKTPDEKRTRKVAVYDLKNGIVAQGANAFAKGELEGNARFKELLVQAKLYNGQIHFKDKKGADDREAYDYIKDRRKIAGVGRDVMNHLMTDFVLSQDQIKREFYPDSILAA